MPFFKTTYNILVQVDKDEAFDANWMDSDKLILPNKKPWDYKRDLKIEDVNLWEVIFERSGGVGVYASWDPYAEFYLITYGYTTVNPLKYINGVPYTDRLIETYYGQGAQKKVIARMKELNIPFSLNDVWVDQEELWLYQDYSPKKLIL